MNSPRRRSSQPYNFHNNGSGDKCSPVNDETSLKAVDKNLENTEKKYVPKCCGKSAALLSDEQKYHPKVHNESPPATAEVIDVDSRGNDVESTETERTCTPPEPPIRMSCTTLGITVNPSPIPTQIEKVTPKSDQKSLKRKWPYNWRLEQLAKPAHSRSKYVPPIEERIGPFIKKCVKLDPEQSFYMNNLFKPQIRVLEDNIKQFGSIRGPEYVERMKWLLQETWHTIYNYYKLIKMEREERRRSIKSGHSKISKDKWEAMKKEMLERIAQLAIAKQVKKPPKSDKPKKIFSNYEKLTAFAMAKSYEGVLTPRPLPNPISPAALKYEATENMIKLSAVPARWLNVPQPLVPGVVKKSALQYKITKRLEDLALPIIRSEKTNPDEVEDPWAIPKNALTYRATARIIELAKPVERD